MWNGDALIKKKYLINNKVKIVALIFGIMVAFTGCGNSTPVKTELKKETVKDTGSKKTKKNKRGHRVRKKTISLCRCSWTRLWYNNRSWYTWKRIW